MDTLRMPAKLENLELFRMFILERVERLNLQPGAVMKLELALEELLTNIVNYAYTDDGAGEMMVGCAVEDDGNLRIIITDWGAPFDPLAGEDPDLSQSLEERQIGGLGIFLVRQIVDEIHYEREEDRNVLTLVFRSLN
jgi:anti-sigma regulatory factor (Ser/Thr protein kinase)